jgi:peptidoglycan/LPS O-acetylase OafA/YrhL
MPKGQATNGGTPGETRRFAFLDGLRGWAAVVVLLHHVFIDGLPANAVMADRGLWAKVFFLNGTLAVCVFFVISGFSLSVRYLQTGDSHALGRMAAARYLRLAIPIAAVCAITHALLLLGIIPPAWQRPAPLDLFLTFKPSFEQLMSFSLVKVFVAYSGAETYDPPLWTMSYEFYGSFMVFAVVAALAPSRRRTLALGLLFLVLAAAQTYFALFVAGVLIADLFAFGMPSSAANRAGAALCLAGLFLVLLPSRYFGLVYIAGAACLTAGAVFCGPLRRFFESRFSSFLGWISFPLYLTQAAVIYAMAPRALVQLAALGFSPEAQRWIADVLLLPVAFVVAVAFCPVNDFAMAASRRFGARCVAIGDELRERLVRHSQARGLASSRE